MVGTRQILNTYIHDLVDDWMLQDIMSTAPLILATKLRYIATELEASTTGHERLMSNLEALGSGYRALLEASKEPA